MIPYGRQSVDDDDIASVVGVLKGDWLTQGPQIARFEEALTDVTGASYAVAFSSGTAALHGAACVAGLGAGNTVVTSPLSFVASANCARYVGATPAFVDIDPTTLNLDLDLVPPGCDALVPVHYAGLPVDLSRLSHRPRIVIEDAAHALGALTPTGPVGNCANSDMCAFSFHPVKVVTTGEGGAVTTNSSELAARLRAFRSHGAVATPDRGGWSYEIRSLGFNYRMTDIHAALGTTQLGKLERFVGRRNELAARYRSLLSELPVDLPPEAPPGWRHAYHLFAVRVADRHDVYRRMRDAGIGVQVHYVPIYRHPLYADLRLGPEDFPVTEAVYAGLLSLPMYPDLTDDEQNQVVRALEAAQ
ncbi:MAG: DegT/DnrJ/EryC1/StrS family aminotransferase [Actinomycetota bacterium]|nr:DegT/DnrJ/EryC1/StrS family aminotransferase [Actinomycetota bacterium]